MEGTLEWVGGKADYWGDGRWVRIAPPGCGGAVGTEPPDDGPAVGCWCCKQWRTALYDEERGVCMRRFEEWLEGAGNEACAEDIVGWAVDNYDDSGFCEHIEVMKEML